MAVPDHSTRTIENFPFSDQRQNPIIVECFENILLISRSSDPSFANSWFASVAILVKDVHNCELDAIVKARPRFPFYMAWLGNGKTKRSVNNYVSRLMVYGFARGLSYQNPFKTGWVRRRKVLESKVLPSFYQAIQQPWSNDSWGTWCITIFRRKLMSSDDMVLRWNETRRYRHWWKSSEGFV